MVYTNFCRIICLSCLLLLSIVGNASAEKPPKYTVFEGQAYRWNSQMKKYFPYQTPAQRLQEKYLKQQLKNMNSRATMSEPTRIKWWDL